MRNALAVRAESWVCNFCQPRVGRKSPIPPKYQIEESMPTPMMLEMARAAAKCQSTRATVGGTLGNAYSFCHHLSSTER